MYQPCPAASRSIVTTDPNARPSVPPGRSAITICRLDKVEISKPAVDQKDFTCSAIECNTPIVRLLT